jgi:ABC-type dipeptide/oligopeptide/nickel transport system permease component
MLPILLIALKRLGWMVLTLWVVYTLSWALMRSVPGGPFDSEKNVAPEIKRNLEATYRMDLPLPQQYLLNLRDVVFFGDLGKSMRLKDFTVNQVIGQGFPVSASLGIMSLVFAIVVGTIAGVVSAVNRNTAIDTSLMAAATIGIAVPNFVLASVMIIVFVFWLGWLPAAGWGTLPQLVLPAICLGAPFAAYIARLMRAGMLEVLNLDYIRTAYAKGLMPHTVIVKHALRGGILPVVSYLGPATAGILTGSPVLERIFNLPGMASHFIEAALQRDYPLAMGMVVVYTVILLVMNALVDASYSVIDPRVKVE